MVDRSENRQSEEPAREPKKVFEKYLRDLQLTPDDLRKSILDIGSWKGEFEEELRKEVPNARIVSVDQHDYPDYGVKAVNIEALPFPDESFELVLSHNALPTVVAFACGDRDAPTWSEAEKTIKASLAEMVRVTAVGGETRLNHIAETEGGKPWVKTFDKVKRAVEETLLKLNKQVQAEFLFMGTDQVNSALKHTYLLKIKKVPR